MPDITDAKPESITTSRSGVVRHRSIRYGETGEWNIDHAGILLPPASCLDPEEYERRIALYQQRAGGGVDLFTGEPAPVNVKPLSEYVPRVRMLGAMRFTLPDKRSWDEVKTLRCAGCRKLMLGESERDLPRKCRRDVAERLPPVVAGRIDDRPYCPDCLTESSTE